MYPKDRAFEKYHSPCSVTFHQFSNIGVRSMQEFFFFLAGQVEMGHFEFLMFLELSKERKYRITSL